MRPKANFALAAAILLTGVAVAFVFKRPSAERRVESGPTESSVDGSSPPAGTPIDGTAPESPHGNTRSARTNRISPGQSDAAESEPAPPAPVNRAQRGPTGTAEPAGSIAREIAPDAAAPAAAAAATTSPEPATQPVRKAAVPSPLGAALPDQPANVTHTIQDGDTLSALAQRYLGASDRLMEIYDANLEILPSPELLPIGAELRIPLSGPSASNADSHVQGRLVPVPQGLRSGAKTAERTYRVGAADTLVTIAKQFYGDGRRYLQLYDANRDQLASPNDLREGMVLVIP